MKTCFKCGQVKFLDGFYVHPRMPDGYLNKCKECTKKDVRNNYKANKPHYRAYYKAREARPERKEQKRQALARLKERDFARYAARHKVGNAIRCGKLVRQPCEICGALEVEAHHTDYSKPLDVRWLCFKHHREIGHHQEVATTTS